MEGPCLAATLATAEAFRLRLDALLGLPNPARKTNRPSSIMQSVASWIQSQLTGKGS